LKNLPKNHQIIIEIPPLKIFNYGLIEENRFNQPAYNYARKPRSVKGSRKIFLAKTARKIFLLPLTLLQPCGRFLD